MHHVACTDCVVTLHGSFVASTGMHSLWCCRCAEYITSVNHCSWLWLSTQHIGLLDIGHMGRLKVPLMGAFSQ